MSVRFPVCASPASTETRTSPTADRPGPASSRNGHSLLTTFINISLIGNDYLKTYRFTGKKVVTIVSISKRQWQK